MVNRYKNGSLLIHVYLPDEKRKSYLNQTPLDIIIQDLDSVDCYLVGEPFSLGNYSVGWLVYNAHDDLVYTLNLGELENSRTIRLYPRKPDRFDREIINNRF